MPSVSRIAAVGLVLGVVVYPLVGAAQVPQGALGTWKLNVAKSTYSPGPGPKSNTSRFTAESGGGVKIVTDGVDAAGKATHTETITRFDGKEVELRGAALPTTRAYSRIDDRTWQYVDRVNGKVTTTTRVTIAADGKTRTNVTTGTNADGKPVNSTAVWDRQ